MLVPAGLHCEVFLSDEDMLARKCSKLGLIICELVTNAAKHAFLFDGKGLVRIDVALEDGLCRCVVSDNGSGFDAGQGRSSSSSNGSGGKIVDVLIRELRGLYQARPGPGGSDITVVFPAGDPCTFI